MSGKRICTWHVRQGASGQSHVFLLTVGRACSTDLKYPVHSLYDDKVLQVVEAYNFE